MDVIDTRSGLRYLLNKPQRRHLPDGFSEENARQVLRFHRTLPGYRPTRLVRLRQLARRWHVKEILVKDESMRLDLNAFKVLGASFAILRLLCRQLDLDWKRVDFAMLAGNDMRRQIEGITLVTATDGNHGRGVAWVCEQLGIEAVVYMPKGSASCRINAIRSHGATVTVTDMNYDDTVRLAGRMARDKGWYLIQDTAWEGDTELPRWIMQGYTSMGMEAVHQIAQQDLRPTHVVLQAGVGAFAAALVAHLANIYHDPPPCFIIVEPARAACMLASAAAGNGSPRAVRGDLETIMVGLACGEPSLPAWQILREWTSAYLSCDDWVAANGMRILAGPLAGDDMVEAGESGGVGIGLLDLMVNQHASKDLKHALHIGPDAIVLCFNTEGATDPDNYRQILWYGKYAGQDPTKRQEPED